MQAISNNRSAGHKYCYKIQIILSQQKKNMLTILLLAAGLICFWFFFKTVDWFEKI